MAKDTTLLIPWLQATQQFAMTGRLSRCYNLQHSHGTSMCSEASSTASELICQHVYLLAVRDLIKNSFHIQIHRPHWLFFLYIVF